MLTLSSHRPFDVPFSKFDDKELNAFAFSDECVGRMVDKLKASPAWDNLLLVLVADTAIRGRGASPITSRCATVSR